MYLFDTLASHPDARPGRLARLLAVFLTILLLCVASRARAVDGSFGVHGMVLFGGKGGLYASHLPMFHAPHDAQVVLRVRFTDAALDSEMRSRLEGRGALWTLEPERFALRRLAPQAADPLQGFSANVVEGHFEQRGNMRHQGASLAVEQVILYQPLDPSPSAATVSRYLPVGPFLVKLIDSRPDFDHIVLLKEPLLAAVSVPKGGMEANIGALRAHASVLGTLYHCADDLR